MCLQRLHKTGILHQNISINNIIYILKKSNNIVLENGACVLTNVPTLLTGSKDSGFAVFLNDYNFAVYTSKAFDIITLIGTWAFIALTKLLK